MVHCTDVNLLSRAAMCKMCSKLDEAHAEACSQLRQCLTDTELSQLYQPREAVHMPASSWLQSCLRFHT